MEVVYTEKVVSLKEVARLPDTEETELDRDLVRRKNVPTCRRCLRQGHVASRCPSPLMEHLILQSTTTDKIHTEKKEETS